MAFVLSDLTAVEQAIKSGELRVQYADRAVVYRGIDDLLKARDFILSEVNAPASASSRKAKQVRFSAKRGL